ncbi:MAG: adenylate/guanylate cyclase domain-containing protein [Rhizobiales bacterium]|nr:adenylate/guanylate cyclase domain-containing protein [Hyphomicrobiales bacterium]
MSKQRQTLKRKITAIMAADIAEYTRITAEDEEETLARLESYREVFDDFVKRAGGRVFNTGGDSIMCEFASAVEATRCAIDIQESLRTRNFAYPPNRQMHFRIGISIGDVVERDGDLLGDGVNIAARLQSLAEPGSICVARNVQEAVQNKIALPFVDLGHREVKNLPHPVHAFQIEMGGRKPKVAAPAMPKPLSGALGLRPSPRWAALWLAAGIAIVASGTALYWMGRADQVRVQPIATAPPQPQNPPETQPAAGATVVVTENLSPSQAFEKLAKSGGLVKDASSAAELYHNARTFEARGESANARRDYLALAALDTDYIDPLLRLSALIRAQDGRAGAREIFTELAKGKSRAAALVHAQQYEGAERTRRLAALAEANPDFAPAQYLLAIELGEDRQNAQTIDERRRELAALSRFLLAEREGRLVSGFLDQSVLAQWLDHAQKREAAAKTFFAEGRDRISAQFMRSNTGWIAAITLPEAATRMEYRLDSKNEFRTTGFLQALDPRTGRPMPNPGFELPPQQGATEIALRYLDANGAASHETIITFDPKTALQRGMRDILERFSTSWLAFGSGQNSQLLYFTHLVSYRCAIEKVEIGYNGKPPQEVISLPPCDPANPYAVPANARPYITLRSDAENASIRITFVGGDISDIKTFQRPR